MYYYVYDSSLNDKKFDRVIAEIETRLTDLGITGKIGRLTPFTNAKGLVRDETRRGARTIVVVGNDATVSKVVAGLPSEVPQPVKPVARPLKVVLAEKARAEQERQAQAAAGAEAENGIEPAAAATVEETAVAETVAAETAAAPLSKYAKFKKPAAPPPPPSEAEITLAIIPVGGPSSIAESLGIPYGADACDTLSKRVTQKVDLGKVNSQYFLSEVRIPMGRHKIEGEGMFRISAPAADCEVIVSNLRSAATARCEGGIRLKPGDPQDGYLDVLVVPKQPALLDRLKGGAPGATVIPLKKLVVTSEEPITFFVDGVKVSSPNIVIEIDSNKLRVISGKERLFAGEC